ncbi:hypothetical protein [Sorangium sp. So ce131]|uniref:hypothetical protein n=1 Tax=Sorangium sp. So ce131 TaxID=3133282 RepID=UPI003F5E8C8B
MTYEDTTNPYPAALPSVASCAYDTAWVASLPDPDRPERPRFPAALEWVFEHQGPDGSWGGEIAYEHDRILSTLSALCAVTRFKGDVRTARAVEAGQRYIWQHAHALSREPVELVGFELLLPTLQSRAARAGVRLPSYLDIYAEQRRRKLALIPSELIYSPKVTLVHSIEFLGDDVDVSRLASVQWENGSVGSSPAATAFFLHTRESEAAVEYLRRCLALDGGAAVPVVHPCETYDLLWSAYHRFLGGERGPGLLPAEAVKALRAALDAGEGISASATFPLPDADDTAVAILLLRSMGYDVKADALSPFERDGHYASYPYERHASSGVNMHVLDTLKWLPPTPERSAQIGRILTFLADTRTHGTYWIDKWHISPYYATAHALAALADLPEPHSHVADELARTALDWVRQTQNADGSWGFYDRPTAEETAYGVLALRHARRLALPEDDWRLELAVDYLLSRHDAEHPPLWIEKCLYTPRNIVNAAIEAALQGASRRRVSEVRFLGPPDPLPRGLVAGAGSARKRGPRGGRR